MFGLMTSAYAQDNTKTANIKPFNITAEVKKDVPMPPSIVLIFCKTESSGENDINAKWTNHQNLKWATEYSKMVCRRQEIQVFDQAAAQGAQPQPFNINMCQRSGMSLGATWDATHPSSKYRFWRVACPVPIKNYGPDGLKGTKDDRIVSWYMPECGHRDTVTCEVDSEI